MNISNSQNSFSKLFQDHKITYRHFDFKNDAFEHPFIFIQNYLLTNKTTKTELSNFNFGYSIIEKLQLERIHSYNCFELELHLLEENRINYLNDIITCLLKLKKDIKINQTIGGYDYTFQRILMNLVNKILKDIFLSYHLDLNSKNRIILSQWFHLKVPITSFRLKIYPEDKRFERLMGSYLIHDFISTNTKFSTFKSLFEGRYLENKINWIDRKSSLYYFIKLLISSSVIINPKNKHWLIASEFFLLNGETLIPKDFLNQKETQNKEKRKILERFVNALKE